MFIINNKYSTINFCAIIAVYSPVTVGLLKGSTKCGFYCKLRILGNLKGCYLFSRVRKQELYNFYFSACSLL